MPLWAEIAVNLAAAWAGGAAVGLERSYFGRAAGLRTHAIVSLASAAAMLITFLPQLAPGALLGAARLDPGRIAQGVMTGVGFIGGGVIFKEGVSVQGLTTAAAIWAAAAIGMLMGLGLYLAGALVTGAVLVTLVGFRWLENLLPEQAYALAIFRFNGGVAPDEVGLKKLLSPVTLVDASFALTADGEIFEFRGVVRTQEAHGLGRLAERLRDVPGLAEFSLSRISK